MLTKETVTKLNSLKLYGMAKGYEELQMTARAGEVTTDEALGILVDREQLERDNRATGSRLKRAKLRERALVEDIDWRHPRGLDKSVFRPLISCEWIRLHQNIIFVGPTGLGKTWLACALAHRACSEGLTTQYIRIPRLFGALAMARADGSYERVMRGLSRTDLLIFDDWGQALAEQERRDFREIIEERYDRGSVIVTTQLPTERWHEVIGDATLADAIVDRIVNRAHRISLSGDTMRKAKVADGGKKSTQGAQQ